MIASELKVYRDTYLLCTKLMDTTMHFPRMHKYTLGQKINSVSLELFEYIQLANMFKQERLKYLNGFIVKFELLKILIRIAGEKKLISLSRQAESGPCRLSTNGKRIEQRKYDNIRRRNGSVLGLPQKEAEDSQCAEM